MKLISIVNVSKRFGDIVALDAVSLDIYRMEILGVLGENGSGKSTLGKILYGVYVPDSGHLELHDGRRTLQTYFASPKDAMRYGIAMISQRPQLVEELTALENIALFLGKPMATAKSVAKAVLDRFGIRLDLNRDVSSLSYTEKQLVELVKALCFGPRLLVVDEVTAYLPENVRNEFYRILKDFVALGNSVVFITHKIREAVGLCDRIAVLRKGKVVNVYSRDEGFPVDRIREAMFDHAGMAKTVFETAKGGAEAEPNAKEVLRVENVVVLDDYRRKAVNGASFSVKRGTVFAIVGVAGNGQKELCEGVAGLRRVVRGRILLDGEDITKLEPAKRILKGLSYVPEDPFRDGVASDLTIAENLRLFSAKSLNPADLDRVLEELRIQPRNPGLKVYKLSGGNVQKVSLSRLSLAIPKCVVVHNPTRMLDEVSSRTVKAMLRGLASSGAGVLIVTEDIDEALEVADAIGVISGGRIVKVFGVSEPNLREEIERVLALYD